MIEDLAGQLIGGRYRIRELVGIGGMDSTVWKAWQTGTERVVAVKVLPAAEEAAAKRFARGARIAANLNHPNCTVVHDYGRTDDGKLFLVMEYLNGQVLQEILGPEGMSAADTIHVADQVLQALEHAHGQRAVHRDLKPDNLFLSRKNDDPLHVKILDFGISKYVEEDPDNTAGGDNQASEGFEDLVTEQRQVCGTPQYMAPEQVVGARIDGRTDLYSLGVVMYRMLTGRLPFDGKTRYELYQKHLQELPKPFHDLRPDLVFPARLEQIVMKVLSKRPDLRFQNAAEMRNALAAIELPDDRQRRGVRPRVSLKHTAPQEPRSGSPTVLPGGMWTLSQPAPPLPEPPPLRAPEAASTGRIAVGAPPPLPPGVMRGRPSVPDAESLPLPADLAMPHAVDNRGQGYSPTIEVQAHAFEPLEGPTTFSNRAIEQRKSGQVPDLAPAADPSQAAASRSVRRPSSAGGHGQPFGPSAVGPMTLVAPESTSPRAPESGPGQSGRGSTPARSLPPPQLSPPRDARGAAADSRTSTNLLSDAVMRHPAGRSSLAVAPEVPRSTETEPNRAREAGEKRRRRLGVVAVLAGAFLIGVGGVALTMHLVGKDSSELAEATTVEGGVEPVAAATGAGGLQEGDPAKPAALPGSVVTEAGAAVDRATRAEVPTSPDLLVESATTTAGTLAGHALSEVPVAPTPSKVPIKIDSDPQGAIVSEGLTILGPTPLDISVTPGRHVFTLARTGFVNAIVEVDALSVVGAAPLSRKLVLAPERVVPVPQAPHGPGGSYVPAVRKPTPTTDPNKILQDLAQPEKAPEVKPENIVTPPPTRQNPQVKLLDDKPTGPTTDPSKKPTIKLLDEDETAPKKPVVKVLE